MEHKIAVSGLLILLGASAVKAYPYSSSHTHYHQDGTQTTCTYTYDDRARQSSSRCHTFTLEERRNAEENIGKETESLLESDLVKIEEFLKINDIDNACKRANAASMTINKDVFSSETKRELYRQKLSTLISSTCGKLGVIISPASDLLPLFRKY